MQIRLYFLCAICVSLMLVITACNLAALSPSATPPPATGVESSPEQANPTVDTVETLTVTSTTIILHTMIPGTVPGSLSIANDTNSMPNADLHYATAGDLYDLNRFERPFTQDGMVYLPALDIQELSIGKDTNWYYATLMLSGVEETTSSLNGDYGLELDLNKDGRGDILIWASPPYSTDWSTSPITTYTDPDGDVGGGDPLKADTPVTDDGYESVIFDGGQGADPDLAWVRLSPDSSKNLEFAFKPSLLNGSTAFLIGGWADGELKDPSRFNYNDHFTLDEAGSALHGDANYPIKAIYALDSTCRAAIGFTPNGSESLVCPLPSTPVPPQTQPGSIRGVVSILDADGHGTGTSLYPVYLFANSCTGTSINSANPDSNGNYSFPNLPSGTYCVDLFYSGSPVQPSNPQTVSVSDGSITIVNFDIVPPG